MQKSISSRNERQRAADRFRFLNFSARFSSQVYGTAAHARGGDEPIGAREDEPAGKPKRRAVAATTQTRPLGTRTWAFVGVGCVFFRARSRSQEGRRSARGDTLQQYARPSKEVPARRSRVFISNPSGLKRSSLSKCVRSRESLILLCNTDCVSSLGLSRWRILVRRTDGHAYIHTYIRTYARSATRGKHR